ncbi:intermembrane transport protein PqiB [Salinisphaera hydrothermalis]|uniref:Paraquat-inducible protein B n=1 Tax=Salinisphaera hydrothermalis (strain C41B8) TaxID=1304275 RepID=A0A084IRA0_SALHC|nr:intermembrane transport protein PqiB [Salinisphaera hydrothermalis]KEZ79234.1 paraquat-inducible protein B [Salinisphaera hydrothermalis C41B8]
MSDTPPDDTAELSEPRRWRISPVWLIPLAAALIGGWLVYDNFTSRGPVIQLDMDTAEGIDAGNTQLKVRSVPVGHVTDVSLADNYKGAVVTVQMNPDTGKLLGDDAQFWVVKPRVGPQGISGLNTIISGAYLQMRPADKRSDKRHFKVQDNPPPTPSNKPGLTVKLVNSGDNTLSVGDPIVYQGQNVGQIEDSQFSVAKRQTVYTVFIGKPYSQLITNVTQFWLRSGVDLHLGSDGVDVQLGSLQSVLAGGITFGQPEDVDTGKPAKDGARFKLYETHNAATQDRYTRKLKYVVLLDDSVRGLSAGAAVEYRGLRVGTVEKVPFYPKDFKPSSFSGFKIPVLISIEPQRPSLSWAHMSNDEWHQRNEQFFKHGLRATIKSSNLLTGAMFIDLTFDHHAKTYHAQKVGPYRVFPSEPSQITSIQQQLSNLMDKLNNLDIGPIVDQLKHAASTTNDTLEQLQQATHQINKLLAQPGTQRLPGELSDTLQQLQNTLDNFQQGAPAYQQLNQTIERLNQVLDNAAPLTRTLRDHPNSLIFGRPQGKDPVPRAHP